MSYTRPATTSSSNFQLIIDNALKEYERRTRNDLLAHPLAAQLQDCDSPTSILAVLQQQVQEHNQSRTRQETLTGWLDPTVNVLYAFSAILGEGVGLVFSPAGVIFTGVGILLAAAKDVRASQDTLVDIFERIEGYFRRLEIYTALSPTAEMMDVIVKIMVEVLCILGIATKETKQGRAKKYVKKLIGRTDLEDALKKLDKLTQEEAQMATAEVLKATHAVDNRVRGVDNRVAGVDDRVAGVADRVAGIDDKVASVNDRVISVTDMVAVVGERAAGIDDKVAGVGEKMAGVDDRVKTVDTRVTAVDDRVRAVDDKVAVVLNDGKETSVVIQRTANDVDQLKRNQLRENLRRWLSPSDPSTNHNIACGAHHDGTASWFFQGSVFKRWKSTGSLLWIHGKPGSGKSILCSTIIEDIAVMCRAGQASMCYFYFDFRDANKQRWNDLVPSLLTQLSAHSPRCCDLLSRLYDDHDSGGQQPSDRVLARCLKEMLTLPDERPIYLIMDALDECPTISSIPSPRERVLQLVKELVNLQLPNLHICVTSRPEIDIRDVLEPLTSSLVSLHDQSGQKEDIVAYIRSMVYSDSEPIMRRWKRRDKDCVIETLSERADGMFRWVFCQLEMLRHCLPSSVRRTLDELPESLDETYARVLREIKKPNRDHALRLLQCLVVAIRPLRVEELAEVLAVEFDDAEGIPKLKPDWRWEDEEQALLTSCSSLIAIVNTDKERVVQFSHFSVKEFLTSPRLATSSGGVSHYHIVLETAHTILAQACLSVLLWLDDGIDKSSIRKSFPLARYAAEHWSSHAQFKSVSTSLRRAMECLFDLDRPHFAAWLRLYDIDVHPSNDSTFFLFAPARKSSAIPLYYAALCGFLDLVKHLIVKHLQHVDAHGGHYVTPLVAALAGEHFQVAQILVDNGAEMDVRAGFERTPLIDALVKERLELARWLLSRGADPNVQETKGWTALHFAAWEGRVEVVRVLLHHDGVDPNIQEKNRWTALHFAASNSHLEIVRILLEHDRTNPNVEDSGGWTPLHFVSSEGHVEVLRMLLRHNRTDPNVQEEGGQTALHLAASRGRVEVVQMLLEHYAGHGAHSNVQGKDGRTALHLAVSHGHLEVVRILLQHNADHGVLLEYGAGVNCRKEDGSTALHDAAMHGGLEVARLLVERGANLDIEDNKGRTAVQVAMANGHHDIVNLLSDRSSS